MDTTVLNIEEWNGKEQWHPMGHPNDMLKKPPLIIKKGEGVYIEDNNGHKMIDGVAGLWNINCGYNRQEIKDAIINQLDELVYYSTFKGTSHPRSIELAHLLIEMMKPENMKRVMFSSGGSDAMETAMRIARQYWKMEGQKDRFKFISLKQGYHGTHFGAASVNGNTRFRRNYEPLLPGCSHIDAPWTYRNPYTEDPEALGKKCAELLEREIQFQSPDTVAAFIMEPILGAGGVIVPPDNFMPLVREICDKYGVLLIADEVVTGFGRSGSMFGSRSWGVKPDIMTLAKGISSGYIPLGATVCNERIDNVFKENNDSFGAIGHGYTYAGHPVACAAAIAALKIVIKEDLPGNAKTLGTYLMDSLKPLENQYKTIGDIRGKGLMLAIEFVEDKASKKPNREIVSKIHEKMIEKGAFVRASGNTIIISPPLVINKKELDVLIDAFTSSLIEIGAE
ncbi:aminotransferase class III-fold pyridoxal phosphate-dependent enzyme [Aquimarina sp. I32.4]|uniref:aminotransferase class III-fold pyridoxal phosphate-dependent enzyme n=1 Tax=Aquimarina sp. I32.4 TaxID=2053903 RepID=UPI000CDF0B6C|nr:aminotransferase class III-fold pyridoxal phosphate-dependent enzyme [Aquimarina sp. I32.4]